MKKLLFLFVCMLLIACGGRSNNQPCPTIEGFCPDKYLDANPGLKDYPDFVACPGLHYLRHGKAEGLDPCPGGKWSMKKVAVLSNGYKAISANWLGDDYYVTNSRVYIPELPNKSCVHRNGVLLKCVSAETLADPTLYNGALYYASEHSLARKVFGDNVHRLPVGGPGQWAITTALWDGQPVMFVNRQYSNRVFSDGSEIKNMITGATIGRIINNGFVRDTDGHYMTVGWNGGHENLQHRSGGIWPSTVLTIARSGAWLYGGGDMRYGYGTNNHADGNVYRWRLGWEKIGNTGARNVMDMNADGNLVCIAGVEPATLSVLEDGVLTNIWKGQSGQGGRSFGATCDVRNGKIVSAFSFQDRKVHVFMAEMR